MKVFTLTLGVLAALSSGADARLGRAAAVPAPGRALAAPAANLDQDRFNDLLAARLQQLAQQSCHTVPALPEAHAVEWGYDLQTSVPPGGAQPLAPLSVRVGDTITFTTHEHNPDFATEGHKKQGKSWVPNLLRTREERLFASCDFGAKMAGWDRIMWGSTMLKGRENVLLVDESYLNADGGENTVYFATENAWRSKWSWCKRNGVRFALTVKPRATTTACEGSLSGLLFVEKAPTPAPTPAPPAGPDPASEAALSALRSTVTVLSNQLMLAQTQAEERVRSQGSSGLVSVRRFMGGHAAWADQAFAGRGFAAMHNHGDFMDTLGMGEIEVVMNGVDFRTRHNDFRLLTPAASREYGAVEPVAMPDVPQAVLDIQKHCPTRDGCVPEQVREMQAWFEAWKNQDAGERDYTKHFQPVLCYLEGAWVVDADVSDIQGASDRHSIEAGSYHDLRQKTRYMANSGRKNTRENLAQLPSAVRGVDADGKVTVANFEYAIKCEKLAGDVPLNRFRVAQDLQTMLAAGRGGSGGRPLTRAELAATRRARFELHPALNANGNLDLDDDAAWGYDLHTSRRQYEYIDTLMEQVWGKDNRGAELEDVLEGQASRHHQRTFVNADGEEEAEVLNVAKYSRFYKNADKDAMGFQERRRGFNDRYLWAARTTQEKVSAVEAAFGKDAHDDKNKLAQAQRWSYALPLEIVYTTPLTKWNPYNITDHTEAFHEAFAAQPACCREHWHAKDRRGACPKDSREYKEKACIIARDRVLSFEKTVTQGGRTGRKDPKTGECDPATAFDGAKRSAFRRTPASFFSGGEGEKGDADPADTSGAGTCVLDDQGRARLVRASGHNIFTNQIGGGVGALRQRWPIVPLHAAGGSEWKETKALAALTLGVPDARDDALDNHPPGAAADFFEDAVGGMFGLARERKYGVALELENGETGEHVHVWLPARKVARMDKDCGHDFAGAEFAALQDRGNDDPFRARSKAFKDFYGCASFATTDEALPDGAKRSIMIGRSHATGEYRVLYCQKHNEPATRRFDGSCGEGFATLSRAD